MIQVRSPAHHIKTLLAALAVATVAHQIYIANGRALLATDYADANAINGYVYVAEISGAPKVAGTAFAVGDALYWDAAAGNVTKTSAGNTLIGHALEPSAAADTVTGLIAFDSFATA